MLTIVFPWFVRVLLLFLLLADLACETQKIGYQSSCQRKDEAGYPAPLDKPLLWLSVFSELKEIFRAPRNNLALDNKHKPTAGKFLGHLNSSLLQKASFEQSKSDVTFVKE